MVTLELKVTEGDWTVGEYRAFLRHQLVDTYMKEPSIAATREREHLKTRFCCTHSTTPESKQRDR